MFFIFLRRKSLVISHGDICKNSLKKQKYPVFFVFDAKNGNKNRYIIKVLTR